MTGKALEALPMKRSPAMHNKGKKDALEVMLEEIRKNGIASDTMMENEVCLKHYEKWTSVLRRSYSEALQKEDLEPIYTFNRRMGLVMQQIIQYSFSQKNSALFAMGVFSGVFTGLSDMLPKRNQEQLFHRQMVVLKERAYVKQILKILFENGCTQHKQICDKINISASQLNRTMSDLIEVGCVKRYRSGKASVYMLTAIGEKYVGEFLGYEKWEYDLTMLSGKKRQIEQKENEISDIQAYCLLGNADKRRKERKFYYDSIVERGETYE